MSFQEGSFEIPQLILELRGDSVDATGTSKSTGRATSSNNGGSNSTLVRCECQEFVVSYDKSEEVVA